MSRNHKNSTPTLGHWYVSQWARINPDRIDAVARKRKLTHEEVVRRLQSMDPAKLERMCGIPRGAWEVPLAKHHAA